MDRLETFRLAALTISVTTSDLLVALVAVLISNRMSRRLAGVRSHRLFDRVALYSLLVILGLSSGVGAYVLGSTWAFWATDTILSILLLVLVFAPLVAALVLAVAGR